MGRLMRMPSSSRKRKKYKTKKSAYQRFFEKVVKTDEGCWIWTGSTRGGYGTFWLHGTMISAHRYSYELTFGPVDKDKVFHHHCRTALCVNPHHLEVVESYGQHSVKHHPESIVAQNKNKTHCKRGHKLSKNNVRVRADGTRQCKTCEKQYISPKDKQLILKGLYNKK